MNLRDLSKSAETHLNDLQADVEAGSRFLRQIDETGTAMREAVVGNRSKRDTSLLRVLMDGIADLKSCILQQRETLRELRQDIRRIRRIAEQE